MLCFNTLLVLIIVPLANGAARRTDVTVSGISSGGAMATQMHIAFSQEISGCGILAGPPYYCGGNGVTTALCMTGPALYVSVSALQLKINSYVSSGSIDAPSNIKGDPVYVFSGKYDTVAYPGVVKLNEDLYSRLGADVKTNFLMAAAHGFPTENFGGTCAVLNSKNYINNCNFNLAYDMLNHLLGKNLVKPTPNSKTPLPGQLLVFDQEAFMNFQMSSINGQSATSNLLGWLSKTMAVHKSQNWNGSVTGFFRGAMPTLEVPLDKKSTSKSSSLAGFDEQGFVYFPSSCANGQKCSIHVALHGCQQGKSVVGDIFATKAGYLEVAELNNIIVIFPQVLSSLALPINPMGCWDWWGYSSIYYATRGGPQMSGVKKMIDSMRVINQAFIA